MSFVRRPIFVVALLIGIPLGAGLFTMDYAEGLSYASNNPDACVNCHIMRPQYEQWLRSSHHAVAVCNDCHVPEGFFAKYYTKAENGYHHSKGFTLEDFHEPIMIKTKSAQVVQENCLRCHGDFVHSIVPGSSSSPDAVKCVHCHTAVGHAGR